MNDTAEDWDAEDEPIDHVNAWRMIGQAKAEFWTPAKFARRQCAAWGIDLDLIQSNRNDDETKFCRYILINRLKAAYPRMSSKKIGQFLKKDHGTVLFALGTLKCRQPAQLVRSERK